jgi:hypothetical protein
MLNNKPNNPSKYNQGNYIPKNKDKIIKLNDNGGLYYRSGLEKKIMFWLDLKEDIVRWGAECIRVPYQVSVVENGLLTLKTHSYYADFYYEMKVGESIRKVVVEVKPMKEYEDAILFKEGKFNVPTDITHKKLKNLEWRFKTAQKNYEKWESMIKWCNTKGFEFIIITEQHLKKFNI